MDWRRSGRHRSGRREEVGRDERVGGFAQAVERYSRALGDVVEGVAAVGQVEHPEDGELALAASVVATDQAVEAAAAELRLALGGEVLEALAALEPVDDALERRDRAGEGLGAG